jgi:hypothetical protein
MMKSDAHFLSICVSWQRGKSTARWHFPICKGISDGAQVVSLPEVGTKLKFKDYGWMQRCPYVVYLDFEATNIELEDDNEEGARTIKLANQVANSYCFAVVNYDGVISLRRLCTMNVIQHCITELKKVSIVTCADMAYLFTEKGYNGDDKLLNAMIKCRDHCHHTGAYRGAVHARCNLDCKVNNELPVFIHNA